MLIEPQIIAPNPAQNVVVYRVGELPGSTARLDVRTEGRTVAETFRANPSLPGIILCDGERVTAGLSQQEFLRHMSRPFGMEVYLPRPIGVLVEHARLETLQIDGATTIEDAVEKCLGRPAERLYDPVLVVDSDGDGAKLVDCQTLFLAVSSTASLRARQMGRILQAVPIGLMLFDRDGRVSPEYSEALSGIFEREELSGFTILDLLSTMVPDGVLKKVRDYLGVLFNPRLIDRLIKGINPVADVVAEFEDSATGQIKKKYLGFSFERVRIGNDIAFILAMVEDRTRRVLMDEEIRLREDSAERKLKLVVQMMALEASELHTFLQNLETACADGTSLAEAARLADPSTKDLTLTLYRNAHSLKGEAGMLGLEGFREALHDFEDPLRNALQNPRAFALDSKLLETCAGRLHDLLSQARDGVSMLRRISRDRAQTAVPSQNGDSAPPAPTSTDSGLATLLRATERLVAELCQRYGKTARFVPQANEADIPTDHHGLLRQVVQQLVRNSLVHGVESPEERKAAGKNPVAMLQFAARPRNEFVEYVLQDDGRGVEVERLAVRAGRDPSAPRAELLNLIFTPGLSSIESDNLDAGRGIGLDMVRDLIERAGGSVAVHDKPGSYCAFQFLIPRSLQPQ